MAHFHLKPGFHFKSDVHITDCLRLPASACVDRRYLEYLYGNAKQWLSATVGGCLQMPGITWKKVEPVQLCGTSRLTPAPYDYIEKQILVTCDSRRQPASPLLLRINHVLLTAQSNGLNFPNADRSRFLTIPYGYMETSQPGDCRRWMQAVAGSLRGIWKPGFMLIRISQIQCLDPFAITS